MASTNEAEEQLQALERAAKKFRRMSQESRDFRKAVIERIKPHSSASPKPTKMRSQRKGPEK
jgi:hypothetical protein